MILQLAAMQTTLPIPLPARTPPPNDYYEIRNADGRFVCHVFTNSSSRALKTARNQGLSLGRGSRAFRIGLEAYGARLRASLR
jgi:hypothetical protein